MKLDSRGFTILEIIITLAITVIVITMAGRFFITNIKSYGRINDSSEIHDQAQFVSVYLDDKISKSSGVVLVKNVKNQIANSTNGAFYIKEIEFDSSNSKLNINQNFKFLNNSISCNNMVLGNYLDSFYVSPIPSDYTYIEARGIKYKLRFLKNDSEYILERSIYFRNK